MSEQKPKPGKGEKRQPGRPQERVSLKPLEFEEALADLLKTEPPEKPSKSVAKKPN